MTFASWGVDYLKEDSCYGPSDFADIVAEYALMRDSLNQACVVMMAPSSLMIQQQTGRPIYFSLCEGVSWYAPMGLASPGSFQLFNITVTTRQLAGQLLAHRSRRLLLGNTSRINIVC